MTHKTFTLGARFLLGILFLTFLFSAAYFSTPKPVSVPSSPAFTYEVVKSPTEQERGLGGRAEIAHDYGMLFVFPTSGIRGFWMKDMLTSIDIIWLSEDGVIVGIEDSVNLDTYPNAFTPPVPVRLVLETRAGETRLKGWQVGTKIALPYKQF